MSMSMQMPQPEGTKNGSASDCVDATFSTQNFGNGWDGGQGDVVIPPL